MRLTRYRPSLLEAPAPWPALPMRFQNLMDDFFVRPAETFGWNPAVDIVEKDGELLMTAELPGMRREDIQLEIADGMLTLKGEKRGKKNEEDENYRLVERSWGVFERTFTLPRAVDAEHVKAEFLDGVLTVHLPMSKKAAGRRVDITVK